MPGRNSLYNSQGGRGSNQNGRGGNGGHGNENTRNQTTPPTANSLAYVTKTLVRQLLLVVDDSLINYKSYNLRLS